MAEVWIVVKEKSYCPVCRNLPLVNSWWFLDGVSLFSSKDKAEEYVATEGSNALRLKHWSEDASVHDFEYTMFEAPENEDTTYKYTVEKLSIN